MTKARELSELGDKLTVDGSGNVDIAGRLTTDGLTVESNSAPTVTIRNTRSDTNWDVDPVFGSLDFYSNDGSGGGTGVISSIQSISPTATGAASNLTFNVATGSANNVEAMRIDQNLNVGIGTSSPAERLTVDGNIRIEGASYSLISNNTDVGREILQLRAVSTVSNGAGLNLYGDADTTSPSATIFYNGNSESMRIDSSGRVGVGTATPECALHVNGTNTTLLITEDSEGSATLQFGDTQSSTSQSFAISFDTGGTNQTLFKRNNSKVGMWTNEGFVVGVGANATSPYAIFNANNDSTKAGVGLRDVGYLAVGRYNEQCAYFNRMNSNGTIVDFRKDGTEIGVVGVVDTGTSVDNLYVGTSNPIGTGVTLVFNQTGSDSIYPGNQSGATRDNAIDMGQSTARFDDIYATNGTIQTSDANEKQDIDILSDAEQRVAVACKGLLRKFRWKDAVAEKGDAARIHFGIIAQDLKAAFEAEGLDACRYAMFISSTWWEKERVIPAVAAQEAVYDEEGNLVSEAVEAQPEKTVVDHFETAEEAPEGATERTRLGVRYPELLAFIIAAI